MYLVVSFLVLKGRMWDLIVSVPDHGLSFYFPKSIISLDLHKNIQITSTVMKQQDEGLRLS